MPWAVIVRLLGRIVFAADFLQQALIFLRIRLSYRRGVLDFPSAHWDPIVQWSRTLPFHGSNTGSNPVRVATLSLLG